MAKKRLSKAEHVGDIAPVSRVWKTDRSPASLSQSRTTEATPTEYRGVRYRSKCEAMFARYLDISPSCSCFEYEPAVYEIDGIAPDFVSNYVYHPIAQEPRCDRCGKVHSMQFVQFECEECGESCTKFRRMDFTVSTTIIEYKPSRPTRAYIDNCFGQFFKIHHSLRFSIGDDAYNFDYAIYFGSAYSNVDSIGRVFMSSFGGSELSHHVVMSDWIGDFRQDLLRYRFDLEQR